MILMDRIKLDIEILENVKKKCNLSDYDSGRLMSFKEVEAFMNQNSTKNILIWIDEICKEFKSDKKIQIIKNIEDLISKGADEYTIKCLILNIYHSIEGD